MPTLDRNGVKLHYEEAGAGAPPLLFVHGFCGDRTHFRPQMEYFRARHRVVAIDRRGHGKSDKPDQRYTIEGFADDIAWTIRELGLHKPAVVVHSQGGLGLEVGTRYADLVSAIVLVDAALWLAEPLARGFVEVAPAFKTAGWKDVLRGFADQVAFLPTDDPSEKGRIVSGMLETPQSVVSSSWEAFLSHDVEAAARGCRVPLLAIGGPFPSDYRRLKELCPQAMIGQTVGGGHFLMTLVPDQVNAMLERFLAVERPH